MMSKKYASLMVLLLLGNMYVMAIADRDCDESIESCGWTFMQKVGIGAATAAGAVGVVTVGLPLLGFTSAGIAAGSIASSAMSAAAVANGGGVVAGGVVATAQSLAVTGIGAQGAAIAGGAGYMAAEAGTRAWCWLTGAEQKNKN